jgi:hypothetical protein
VAYSIITGVARVIQAPAKKHTMNIKKMAAAFLIVANIR